MVSGWNLLDGPPPLTVPTLPSWQVLEPSFRQAFPNTNRWFLTCINQPQFRAVLGEVKLCEKMAQFDGESEDVGGEPPGWAGLLSLSPWASCLACG